MFFGEAANMGTDQGAGTASTRELISARQLVACLFEGGSAQEQALSFRLPRPAMPMAPDSALPPQEAGVF